MNEERTKASAPLGVAEILPPDAVQMLLQAYQLAQLCPANSRARTMCIERGIDYAVMKYPELFR